MKKIGKPKGLPKSGGRKRGALNKLPKDLRQSITEFLQENFDVVVNEWRQMDNPKEKLSFYRDLLKYSVPVLSAIEQKTDFDSMTDEQIDRIIETLKKTVYE